MKTKYEKPRILFEDFSLNMNIAGDCEIIITTSAEGTCGYVDKSERFPQVIFIDETTGCTTAEPDGYNNMCYHTPLDDNNLFNS